MLVTGRQIIDWEIEHQDKVAMSKRTLKPVKMTRSEYIAHKITCLMRSKFNPEFKRMKETVPRHRVSATLYSPE